MVESAKGCEQLQSAQSIMGYDRPANLGYGNDECRGGIVIDDEARKLLEALYPQRLLRLLPGGLVFLGPRLVGGDRPTLCIP